jgi:hypothetical protein
MSICPALTVRKDCVIMRVVVVGQVYMAVKERGNALFRSSVPLECATLAALVQPEGP